MSAMAAALPTQASSADEEIAFIWECLESLADEWFVRVLRPTQSVWRSATCPFCRRLREHGMDADCPVCEQLVRSRTSGRSDSRKRNQP